MTPPGSAGEGATSPSAARGARRLPAVGSAGQPPPNNLPLELSSFVGREKELAEVKRLPDNTRLLTLTGSGVAARPDWLWRWQACSTHMTRGPHPAFGTGTRRGHCQLCGGNPDAPTTCSQEVRPRGA
jgi:hypothetical protein